MSVVGELPLDVSCTSAFSMPEQNFEMRKWGHSRRPSHRRTASLVMYIDDDILGLNPAELRPGTPPATKGNPVFKPQVAGQGFMGGQRLEEISWSHVEDLKVSTSPRTPLQVGEGPALARSSTGSSSMSKRAAEKPDMQDLFGSVWGGAEGGRSSQESLTSRSSQGTPPSRRSTGSPLKNFFNAFRPKQSYDRMSAPSQGEMSGASFEDLSATIDMKEFQHDLSNYDDDDCESCGTVVELEGESDETLSSQAEDANMRNDLYSEFDKGSLGDDALTNDSIDEDEFPLETIEESALESQKAQDFLVGENSYDMSLKIDAHAAAGDSQGSPRSGAVHSHTVSESSQPESDMPLPEIVTGSILQGLHDELSMKLEEELGLHAKRQSSEEIIYTEHQSRDLPMNDCLQQGTHQKEGTMHFGVQWVRLTPDKHLVSNIHDCIAKAAELVINNWRWVPVVALPIGLMAIYF